MNRPARFCQALRWLLCVGGALLYCASAQAEWSALGRSDNFRIYLESKSMQKDGDFVRAWQLMDFVTAQWADAQTVFGSIKTLVEYDCTRPRMRTLVFEAYSEQMAEGRMVARESLPDSPWEGFDPDGMADKVRQLACAKK